MNLKHTNLTVSDVAAVGEFFSKYFELHEQVLTDSMVILVDDDDFVLTVMGGDEDGNGRAETYPSTFHVGFYLEDERAVDTLRERLVEDGFEPDAAAARHGSYNFKFDAPDDIPVEVGTAPKLV